jgi:hypothetical protein
MSSCPIVCNSYRMDKKGGPALVGNSSGLAPSWAHRIRHFAVVYFPLYARVVLGLLLMCLGFTIRL